MALLRPRGSSLFSGFLLILVGVLLLLHNYHGLELGHLFLHWWPLIIIAWGAIKLYERTAGRRSDGSRGSPVSAGEVFLVIGLIALVGAVVGWDEVQGWTPRDWGDSYPFDLDVAPKSVPANSRITVHNGYGDISIRPSDSSEVRVSGKGSVKAWSEKQADRLREPVSVEIVQNGDGYEIHPKGINAGDSRVGVDMDIEVPSKSPLTVRSEHGDITVADIDAPVTINSAHGDVEVRNTTGDVNVDMRKGDVKVSDVKGDAKISGSGGEVEVVTTTGSLTLDGEFYGPIRADKIAKGVRFVSHRTDLTLTQLSGHMEASSGNLEITDAPGNLALRTNSYDVSIENAGAKVRVDNRNGDVDVRFSYPPKEDIEVTNSNSAITLSFPGSSSFDIVADCHSCDIDSDFSADSLKKTSTESGDSHLEGKYGNGRGPKITLKTSYGALKLLETSGSDMPSPPSPPSPAPAPKPRKAPKPSQGDDE